MTSKLSVLFSFLLHLVFMLALWKSPFISSFSSVSVVEVLLIPSLQKKDFAQKINLKKSAHKKKYRSNSFQLDETKEISQSEQRDLSTKNTTSDFIPIQKNSLPAYPLICRKRGHEGTVQCIVYINEKGHVTKVGLKKSSNSSLLDQVSIETLLSWRFYSAKQNNCPSLTAKEITFHFRLLTQDVTILSS